MKDLCFKIPVLTYGVLTAPTEASQTTSRGRVRIFYKGLNRNGTYITDEFAQKLVGTLPYTPVKGIYSDTDFTDHGEERSEGRIYGVVPEDPNFAWEDFTDEDGVTRTYACCDILLYTALYEEASEIFGKGESMELYLRSIEGDWQVKEGKKCFVFSDGCFLGLQALGDNVEPCFEGAAFYDFNQSIYAILEKANGGNPMDDLNKEVFEEEKASEEITEETSVEETSEEVTSEVDSYEDGGSGEGGSEGGSDAEGSDNAEGENEGEGAGEGTGSNESGADGVEGAEQAGEETADAAEEVIEEASAPEGNPNVTIKKKKDEENFTLESKISELESLNSTLQLERDTFSAQLEEAKGEINSLKEQINTLSEFKNAIEHEQKLAVIDEYTGKLSDEVIQKYVDSLDTYTVEELDMKLCYEIKKGNPSAFFGQKNSNSGIIPKQTQQSNYVDPIVDLLKKYENK